MTSPGPDTVHGGNSLPFASQIVWRRRAEVGRVRRREEESAVRIFVERSLDIVEGFHGREAGAGDVGAAHNACGVLAAFVIALMEVTELFTAKCGRATKNAILLEMVAGTKRHTSSKYNRPTATSGQRKTISVRAEALPPQSKGGKRAVGLSTYEGNQRRKLS